MNCPKCNSEKILKWRILHFDKANECFVITILCSNCKRYSLTTKTHEELNQEKHKLGSHL